MIPGNEFVLVTPTDSRIPNYTLPFPIVLSYRDGIDDFTPIEQAPPFTLEVVSMGEFEAQILAGTAGSGFGTRVELIRNGVYGALLVDTIHAAVDVISPFVEYCPDTTEDTEETSLSVALTSVESCPPIGIISEETSSTLSNLVIE